MYIIKSAKVGVGWFHIERVFCFTKNGHYFQRELYSENFFIQCNNAHMYLTRHSPVEDYLRFF